MCEEQFQTAMQNFVKAIDQHCQHTTTQEWNRIAITGDMTPSELAAKITAMTEAVKHHHPVDQTTLMRKFCHAIPAHHTAFHKKIESYLHEEREHTLQEMARQAHYVYSQVVSDRSHQETLAAQYA